MAIILTIFMITMLPVSFIIAALYFISLYQFKQIIVSEQSQIWLNERNRSKLLTSWVQSIYKILRRINNGFVDGQPLSEIALKKAHRAATLMHIGLSCFMLFLFSALALTFIDPMK